MVNIIIGRTTVLRGVTLPHISVCFTRRGLFDSDITNVCGIRGLGTDMRSNGCHSSVLTLLICLPAGSRKYANRETIRCRWNPVLDPDQGIFVGIFTTVIVTYAFIDLFFTTSEHAWPNSAYVFAKIVTTTTHTSRLFLWVSWLPNIFFFCIYSIPILSIHVLTSPCLQVILPSASKFCVNRTIGRGDIAENDFQDGGAKFLRFMDKYGLNVKVKKPLKAHSWCKTRLLTTFGGDASNDATCGWAEVTKAGK